VAQLSRKSAWCPLGRGRQGPGLPHRQRHAVDHPRPRAAGARVTGPRGYAATGRPYTSTLVPLATTTRRTSV